MTISGVGGSASGYASQMLMSLLARMSSTQNVSSDASSTTMQGSEFPSQSFGTGGVQNALQGPTKPSISEGIMQMLLSLQDDSSTAPANSSIQNPLSRLFSAMDSDSNGAVSQSEMESYVQGQGGTADQADSIFAALSTSGTGSISQSEFAAALEKLCQNPWGDAAAMSANASTNITV
ncbi:MAG: hypothetical protein GC166_04095 [Alphaproteobacteria bacterium]|nr:hypothetical protein [Alphaproteobacteria bacterium]